MYWVLRAMQEKSCLINVPFKGRDNKQKNVKRGRNENKIEKCRRRSGRGHHVLLEVKSMVFLTNSKCPVLVFILFW